MSKIERTNENHKVTFAGATTSSVFSSGGGYITHIYSPASTGPTSVTPYREDPVTADSYVACGSAITLTQGVWNALTGDQVISLTGITKGRLVASGSVSCDCYLAYST